MSGHASRAEAVAAAASDYDDAMCTETVESIYQFGEGVLTGDDLEITDQEIRLPGFGLPVDLDIPNPFV